MKKILLPAAVIAVFLLIGGAVFLYSEKKRSQNIPTPVITTEAPVTVKNSTYTVDGVTFTLTEGMETKELTPGSVTKNILSVFGEPVYGDLNKDGKDDAAVLLVNHSGGSGTFYYAVLAIATGTKYTTTNTLLLGDRIAPQTIEIRDGRAIFNYAERKAGEPMTVQPSMGKSLFVHYDATTGTIGELVQNFEGEADVNKMILPMKTWTWVKTQLNDGSITIPKQTNAFTLTFTPKTKKVAITTDCNTMGGSYATTTTNKTLTFKQIVSTKMFCEGSQEQEFSKTLQDISSYMFTSKGELILEIKMDSGVMIFK